MRFVFFRSFAGKALGGHNSLMRRRQTSTKAHRHGAALFLLCWKMLPPNFDEKTLFFKIESKSHSKSKIKKSPLLLCVLLCVLLYLLGTQASAFVAFTLPYPLSPTIHILSANTTPGVAVLLLRLPLFSTPAQRYAWLL